jgi:MoxR-like ATPase
MLALHRDGLTPAGRADQVAGASDLRDARRQIAQTAVSDDVAGYVVDLVRRTRELPSVMLGVSPRGAVHLLYAARAAARLAGRSFVTPDDVAAMASAALAHRLVLTPDAELERFSAADAVRIALADVPVPR